MTFRDHLKPSKIALLALISIFAVAGIYVVLQSQAARPNKPAVTLSLNPSSQRVAVGTTLPIAVWVDTNGQPVNAVQANLSYPADIFEFVSIDTNNSAFGVEVRAGGSNGSIEIVRGSTSNITGNVLLATVNLRAKANARKAAVNFIPGSAVVNGETATDILQRTVGGQYRVQ